MRYSTDCYSLPSTATLSPATIGGKGSIRIKGAVLLSVVGILLSLITLVLWATSSLLTSEFQASKRSIAYNEVMNILHNDVTQLTEQLRTSEDWQQTAGLFNRASMSATHYVGRDSQHLTLFSVTMTHPVTSLFIRQDFLRHPAIVRIPATGVVTGATNSILPHLFERHQRDFTPMYFPEPHITDDCDELTRHFVFWVRGSCHISGSETIGSASQPVLLVIEKGDFTLDAHAQIYGLVVILSETSTPTSSSHSSPSITSATSSAPLITAVSPVATIASSAKLVGAMVSNEEVTRVFHGHIDFNLSVLRALQQSSGLQKMQPIPGSWHDFN
ncbi:MAG: hypothetical protein JXQ95_09685 [Alteromonas stellipolaris]|uniref:hypothetical protein n=1 Tax=Alteromonas stellipolaris TaxID=233316 RepID=UPI003B8DABA8